MRVCVRARKMSMPMRCSVCGWVRARVRKILMPMRFVELDACLTMRVASC